MNGWQLAAHVQAAARTFAGPAGRLDARMHGPRDGDPVLLLHPHPLWGGSMGSRLVYDLAESLAGAGFLAVRFNFRGVGRSEGGYGQGDGEAADAVAVFDAVAAECGALPAVVGYSFGGAVACRLATLRKPTHLVLVGTPLAVHGTRLDPRADAAHIDRPVHIVVGSRDELAPEADARALSQAFRPPAHLAILPGAGHFLEPSHNAQAAAAVLAALEPAGG